MNAAGTASHLAVVVACAALVSVVALTPRATGAEVGAAASAQPGAAPGGSPDQLVDAPGRDKTTACGACHSLDYIPMNSRFLDLAGWTAVVNKMIKVYGAPIPPEDVEAIAGYLAQSYGAVDSPD